MFNLFKKKPKFGSPEHYEQEFGMPEKDYWKKRWDDSLKGKDIVTRYLICFGRGNYEDFCGVKEIKGYYGKTFGPNPEKEGWQETEDVFYQIDKDDSHNKYMHKPDLCFETLEAAREAYNNNVDKHIKPLQVRIDALKAARFVPSVSSASFTDANGQKVTPPDEVQYRYNARHGILIEVFSDGDAYVRFMDTGDIELVKWKNLAKVPPEFKKL